MQLLNSLAILSSITVAALASPCTPQTIPNPTPPSCPANPLLPPNFGSDAPNTLPTLFTPVEAPQDPAVLEQIRGTLALYPLAIDSKSFKDLNLVFTPDAVANYSAPLNILTPLSTIEATLQASLAPVTTQHSYGTQAITILNGGCTARSVTYFRAAHFGQGPVFTGEVVYAYGQYRDILIKTSAGWRIQERTLAYMGPLIGNQLIFTYVVPT